METSTFVTALSDVVTRITGRDTMSFLQSKLACDTRRWRMHGGGFGLATDINGKIVFEGRFALEGDDVVAVLPESVAAVGLAHLDGYVIMEKVTFLPEPDTRVVAVDGPGAAALLGVAADDEEPSRSHPLEVGGVAVRAFRDPGPVPGAARWLVLVVESDRDALVAGLAARGAVVRAAAATDVAEIRAGIPRLGRDYEAGETIPLEAGLWNGVSLSKGCYLGQEVLERLFSRGSAARRLVRVAWDGPPVAAGTELVAAGAPVGAVTSSVADFAGTGAVGMAWLRRRALGGDVDVHVGVDGTPVRVLDLVGGPDPESP